MPSSPGGTPGGSRAVTGAHGSVGRDARRAAVPARDRGRGARRAPRVVVAAPEPRPRGSEAPPRVVGPRRRRRAQLGHQPDPPARPLLARARRVALPHGDTALAARDPALRRSIPPTPPPRGPPPPPPPA